MATYLHTLNKDIQGLLTDRLLDSTLDQLKRYPVYLLQHRVDRVLVEDSYVCLGDDPKSALMAVIAHLESQCNGNVGFIQAFNLIYRGHRGPLTQLFERRPRLKSRLKELRDAIRLYDSWAQDIIDVKEILMCLLFPTYGRQIRGTAGMSCDNDDLFEMCLRDGHDILKQYLEVEDLVEMLNRPGERDSVLFIPLNTPRPLTHY